MVNPASEGFPWERVDAAKRYLYTIKPWWSRFGERLTVVPTFTEPLDGMPYGAATSTDPGLRLYVDRLFAALAPLHTLAGALEHEFQHHTRDSWRRLTWLDPDEWRRWSNICLDLEINGGMDEESRRLDMSQVQVICSRSVVFHERDLVKWNVIAPPGLDEATVAWIPRVLDLPDRLSAEEYLAILQRSDELKQRPPEQEDSDPEGDDGSAPEGGAGEEGAEDEDDASDDSTASEHSADGVEESDPDDGGAEPDDPRDDAEDDAEDSPSDDAEGGSDGGQSDSSDGEAAGGPAGDAEDEEQPEALAQQGSGKAGGEAGRTAEMEDREGGGEPQIAGVTPTAELAERVAELRQEEANSIWASELQNPLDELSTPDWKPDEDDNARPAAPGVAEMALQELEEDVIGSGEGPAGFGSGPGSSLVAWAHQKRRARGLDWESRFSRLVSSAYNSARTSGASDLSYSVRNPNQPEFGVVLQGLHDYAPKIAVIQDVSGSMTRHDGMSKSMTVFTQLATKVLGRFGEQTTWITVDTRVVDVGRATRWNPDVQTRWSAGYGGTKLDTVITDLMQGRLVWQRRRIDAPDLTVIVSDCQFSWPRVRPTRKGRILVVSVADEEFSRNYLPDWLDWKREVIIIG